MILDHRKQQMIQLFPKENQLNPILNRRGKLHIGSLMNGILVIKKRDNSDFGVVMTYMDVRFLVDDLDKILSILLRKRMKEQMKHQQFEDAQETSANDLLEGENSGGDVEVDTVTS